ncbi:hypothetical protein [Hymenobacter actinosclerus]|uniref:Uncharacterized protein n=1 Tax=Hymenobacter actinosclerus TaxID=82805 RepID=A0A1I0BKZ4_9BACT|nr:hypothetical protein [Hymenobacter actinosclerus]SET07608.1 hypothetical protein SAMN04487998_1112 [Hymenobacter actinosclerus]
MNDPAFSPTPALGGSSGEIQEIFFSSATWKQGVEYYTKLTGLTPNPAGPPTAIFKSKEYEIWVTQTDDSSMLAKQSAGKVPFIALPTDQAVAGAIKLAQNLGAKEVIPAIMLDVYPVMRLPLRRVLTLGMVRFMVGAQLTAEDTTVGVIHNPNW